MLTFTRTHLDSPAPLLWPSDRKTVQQNLLQTSWVSLLSKKYSIALTTSCFVPALVSLRMKSFIMCQTSSIQIQRFLQSLHPIDSHRTYASSRSSVRWVIVLQETMICRTMTCKKQWFAPRYLIMYGAAWCCSQNTIRPWFPQRWPTVHCHVGKSLFRQSLRGCLGKQNGPSS